MGKRKTPGARGRKAGIRSVIRGERVKEIRERRGWSQMELAYRSGMHSSDISGIENGYRDLRTPGYLRLVVALDTSADYLFGLTDTPNRAR